MSNYYSLRSFCRKIHLHSVFSVGSLCLESPQYFISQTCQGLNSLLDSYIEKFYCPFWQMSKWLSIHVNGVFPDDPIIQVWYCYPISGKLCWLNCVSQLASKVSTLFIRYCFLLRSTFPFTLSVLRSLKLRTGLQLLRHPKSKKCIIDWTHLFMNIKI